MRPRCLKSHMLPQAYADLRPIMIGRQGRKECRKGQVRVQIVPCARYEVCQVV